MSLSRSPSLLVGFGALAFLVSGCGETTSPPSLASSYDLVSYEGKVLPAEINTVVVLPAENGGPGGYRCSNRLTSQNLQFLAGNTVIQNESRLLVCDDGRADAASFSIIPGTYEPAEGSVEFITAVGDGRSLHSFARLSGDGLTVYRREVRGGGLVSITSLAPLVFMATP